jgi:hypothetical protein
MYFRDSIRSSSRTLEALWRLESYHILTLRRTIYSMVKLTSITVIFHFFSSSSSFQSLTFVYLIKHNSTKTYSGVDVQIHVYFTLKLVGGVGQLHAPGAFLWGKRRLYLLDGGLDGLQGQSG